jgi:hypothetical protein
MASLSVTQINASATLSDEYNVYLVNCTSSLTITIPNLSVDGFNWIIKRIDSTGNTCTLASVQTINGVASITIPPQSNVTIVNYIGKFYTINGDNTANNNTLATLTDTAISSPLTGEFLMYNGAQWINRRAYLPMAESAFYDSTFSMSLTNINEFYVPNPRYIFTSNNRDLFGDIWVQTDTGLQWCGNTALVQVNITFSAQVSASSNLYNMAIYKNKEVLFDTVTRIRWFATNSYITFNLSKMLLLDTNDSISLCVNNISLSGQVITFATININGSVAQNY